MTVQGKLRFTLQVRDYIALYLTKIIILVTASDGTSLQLDEIYFIWQNVPIVQDAAKYENGQKGAIIELFGWPYKDIALECEAIGKMGYLGVKVYPPQVSTSPSYLFTVLYV